MVHATGYEHLLVNLVLLLLVALPLEMSHGGLRVGAVYSLAVLAASLTSSLFQPGTFLAGASGGVYALSTAHLASMVLNWREDSLIMRQRVRNRQAAAPTFGKVVRFGRILLVSAILLVDVLGSLLGEQKSSVSHLAHLVGAVVGLLVGLVLLRNRRVEHWQTWVSSKLFLQPLSSWQLRFAVWLVAWQAWQSLPWQPSTLQQPTYCRKPGNLTSTIT